jgi:phospholipase A-2-activating protein
MDLETSDYYLSQSLIGHSGAARTLDIKGDRLISGGIDKKVFSFRRDKQTQKFEREKEYAFFKDYIFSVRIVDDKKFVVGCKDGNIYLCHFDSVTQPLQLLQGHKQPVNCLEVKGNILLSGSWDATAKIWDLDARNCVATLEGHTYAVTIYPLLDNQMVTGSQDGNLHLWDQTGKKIKTVEKAHNNIIRAITEIVGVGILTSSNDQTVKLWSLDLDELTTFEDHNSFVFSLANIKVDSLDFVSGGEDFKMVIYSSGKKVQEILFPGTVWSIVIDRENQNDIVAACGDSFVRVFTKVSARKAPDDEINSFTHESEVTSLKGAEGLDQASILKFPTTEKMFQHKGKNGEMKVFREGRLLLSRHGAQGLHVEGRQVGVRR